MVDLETVNLRLGAEGWVNGSGSFEVLAITEGEGNGYQFSADVLRESLSLWDGAECFVDHSFWGHSLRDLAGVCSSPAWDEAARGVAVKLRAVGPSGGLLVELGKEMLADTPTGTSSGALKSVTPGAGGETKPRIGFSADLMCSSKGRKVEKILKIYSLDLVFNPARGGAFKRALNAVYGRQSTVDAKIQEREKGNMSDTDHAPKNGSTIEDLQKDVASVQEFIQLQKRNEELAKEAEAARQLRVQMCGYLLDSGLAAAKLPAAMVEHVRAQFAGKVFEAAELSQAIEEARKLLSELTGAGVVQGPGRLTAMYDSGDRLQCAVDDLFDVPRSKGMENVKAARLSGVRELYLMLTGDDELHGGYYPDRVRLATTSDFTGLVKNALNKTVVNTWEQLGRAGYNWWERITVQEHFTSLQSITGLVKNALNKIVVNTWDQLGRAGYDWWMKITVQEHFTSLQSITGTLVGTVGTLPSVAEGAEYTELAIGDSPETASFTKYGGYIPLTLELIDRDETRKLKAYPRELASAGLRRISALVAAIFTTASGVGPTLADTGALFNSTAVTTKGGHLNLLTTALSAAQWEVVSAAVYNQPMLVKNDTGLYGTGPKMAINPKFLLVPRALQLTAMQILYPSLERASQIYSENLQRGEPGDVVTVPEWTDTTDWAAVCDPLIVPGIFVGERFGLLPEIYIANNELSPAVFMNDEHRLKVRQFVAVWVNDFRPLHKSNV